MDSLPEGGRVGGGSANGVVDVGPYAPAARRAVSILNLRTILYKGLGLTCIDAGASHPNDE